MSSFATMEAKVVVHLLLLLFHSRVACSLAETWPVPIKTYAQRPPVDPYCDRALFPFCPTGFSNSSIPLMDTDDTVEVFLMKAPIWEFKFGDLLGHFDLFHDAIGFSSVKTKLNYTTEWYELFQLFNCTFPHLVDNRATPIWCNQGAVCYYPGIDDKHWKENGTLLKIGQMNGTQFTRLAQYIKNYNRTFPFYETWRVRSSHESNYTLWFKPFDCSNYAELLLCEMYKLGTDFTTFASNFSYITLYSDEPKLLGNATAIFGPQGNESLAKEMIAFYENFQPHQSVLHIVESLIHVFNYIVLRKEFYFYYNRQYWYLPMKFPYLTVSYEPLKFDFCVESSK